MKKILLVLMICLLAFAFGCNMQDAKIEDYIINLEYKEDYKILQLDDIHLGIKDDLDYQFNYLDKIITEADADLIVCNGDLFTFASKQTAKKLFKFLDKYKTHWAVTFGNHDEQCYFSISWLTGYLNKLSESSDSYCVFKDIHNDDVFGYSNFAINLIEGDSIVYQLILIDSNRYNFGEYTYYDYIHTDQIKWYEELIDYTTSLNKGEVVPSICYFHIPVPEFSSAYDNLGSDEVTLLFGERRERVCAPLINTGFFDSVLEKQSTISINCAHDHLNDYVLKYKGIYLAYGLKSTDRIYYDDSLLGGLVLTLNRDGISYEQLFVSYSEE